MRRVERICRCARLQSIREVARDRQLTFSSAPRLACGCTRRPRPVVPCPSHATRLPSPLPSPVLTSPRTLVVSLLFFNHANAEGADFALSRVHAFHRSMTPCSATRVRPYSLTLSSPGAISRHALDRTVSTHPNARSSLTLSPRSLVLATKRTTRALAHTHAVRSISRISVTQRSHAARSHSSSCLISTDPRRRRSRRTWHGAAVPPAKAFWMPRVST